ncbi:MAG: hypothetical protein GSR80_000987 [Desulfurococcales archaeon]|nr:hypothetical protein [Desulfurococcales archaeon]
MGGKALGGGSGSKRFFLALILVALSLPALKVAVAGGYAYEPGLAAIAPTGPTLTLLPPSNGANSAVVDLGPNTTSANITVTASDTMQVLANPDFYTTPDDWYCIPGINLTCYYLSSDAGANGGVVEIVSNGAVTTNDAAFLLQEFQVPTISNITEIDVKYNISYLGLGFRLEVVAIIYDATTNNTYLYEIFNTSSIYTSFSYNWKNISVNLPLNATHTYIFAIGVLLNQTNSLLHIALLTDVRIDTVYLYVNTETYAFAGIPLIINNTASTPRYAQLVLVGGNISPDLNCTLSLVSSNPNVPQASPIVIQNGEVVSNATGIVELDTGSTLYASGYVELQASKVNATNSTLILLLVYYGGPNVTDGELDVVSSNGTVRLSPYRGVIGFYPIVVTIDPGGVRVEALGGRGVGG